MDYQNLNKQLISISEGIDYDITLLANASALIYDAMDRLNWCGFYLLKDGVLLLGPFQGKIACTRIELDKGVCGAAATRNETVLVPNVHEFPGHIACDSASNSEIVIPIHRAGELYGVLDIDSPELDRFSADDKVGLELLVKSLELSLEITSHELVKRNKR